MADKYICLTCFDTFDEPYFVHENEWHGEVGRYEQMCYPVCPHCGSEDFEEAEEEYE